MFQLASDIHLELYPQCNEKKMYKIFPNLIEPSAPFLLLAGDIGHSHRDNYKSFLKWCSERFVKVFVTSGNHEYYTTNALEGKNQHTMKDAELRHREVISSLKENGIDNVFYLQKDRIDFSYEGKNYTVLGCTFWAAIPEELYGYISTLMNDYGQIFIEDFYHLTPSISNALHEDHSKWLFEELSEIYNDFTYANEYIIEEVEERKERRVVVVMTHHAPSLRMDTDKEKYKLKCGYATDYEHRIGNYIHAWVSGHTHENKRLKTKDGTLLISNCIGYKGQNTGYSKECIF